jgi:hypothetical protein
MTTKKGTTKKMGRKAAKKVSPTESHIARLKRENERLRDAIDSVWGELVDIDQYSARDDAINAVDSACDVIITALPRDYHWTGEEPQPPDQAAIFQQSVDVDNKRMAKAMGISDEEFAEIKDANVLVPTWRKIVAEDFGVAEALSDISEEDYKGMVAYSFILTVLFAVKIPLDLRVEMERYSRVLNEMKKDFPKKTRQPGDDVRVALDMLAKGNKYSTIYPMAIAGWNKMSPRERSEARRKLKEKVRALESARRRREGKSEGKSEGGNTSPK